jgi:hypothetical protein
MAQGKATIEISAVNRTKQAFNEIERSIDTVESSSLRLKGALAGIGVGLSVGGLVALGSNAIDAAAKLDDLSEVTGASVEELSKLQQVARISGTDIGVVESFLVKLNKALHETDEEAKGANRALEAIGLSAEELRALDPAEAMRRVATELTKFADSGGKSAAILALTGKSAAQALPFLKDLATETGITAKVTAEQAAAAEELQKSIRRLTNEATEASNAFLRGLVPGLQKLIEEFNEGRRVAGSFGEALALFGTINPFRSLAGNIKSVGDTIDGLRQKREQFVAQGRTGWLPLVEAEIEAEKKRLEFLKFQQRQAALALTQGARGRLDAKDLGPEKKPDIDFKPKPSAGKGNNRGDNLIKQLEQEIIKVGDLSKAEEFLAGIQLGHYDDLSKEAQKRALQLLTELDLKKSLAIEEKERQKTEDEVREGLLARERAEVDRLSKLRDKHVDLIDPIQKYRKELEEVDELLEKGRITSEQANEARFLIQEKIEAAQGLKQEVKETNDLARELGLTFSSMFEDAVVGGKKLRDVMQGLAQDLARILVRKTVTEPFGNFFSGLFAGGLSNLFGGASSVSHLVPGRAGGGPVTGGRPYLVGERGPELFVPRESGSILPRSGNSYYIDARGADAAGLARLEGLILSLHGSIERRAVAAVGDQIGRGGALRDLVRG